MERKEDVQLIHDILSGNEGDSIKFSLVASNNKLYSVTQQHGMFHIPLETDSVPESSSRY